MESIELKCSNCDKHLCNVTYYKEDSGQLKIACQCPYCEDKSFPILIPADKFNYKDVEANVYDMVFDSITKRVLLYAKRIV